MSIHSTMKKLSLLALAIALHQLVVAQSLLFAAKEKGKLYGFIDESGAYVIPPSFDDAAYFNRDIAVVKKGKKYGVINRKGEFVVPAIYDNAILYAPEGKITAMKGKFWGVIDANGKTIIPFRYPYLSVLTGGYVVGGEVLKGKFYKNKICPLVLNEKADTVFRQMDCYDGPMFLPGMMDKKGHYSMSAWPIVREDKIILSRPGDGPQESEFGQLSILHLKTQNTLYIDGLKAADDYFGFREGALAIKEYSMADSVSNGFFIDSTKLSTDYNYNTLPFGLNAKTVHPFFNGVAAIEKDSLWSFIDRQGQVVGQTKLSTKDYRAYPPMYFNGLIALFDKNDLAGYVDKTGKTVIPFQFEEYHPFEYDVTPVKYNGHYGLLKKDGTWAVQPKFEELSLSPCPCYQ